MSAQGNNSQTAGSASTTAGTTSQGGDTNTGATSNASNNANTATTDPTTAHRQRVREQLKKRNEEALDLSYSMYNAGGAYHGWN